MPNSPSICICVPTYNSSKTIIDTLNSISAIDYDNFRIIVVDNNSQDNTIDLINNNFEDIPVYKNSITVSPESNFDRCINLSNEDFTCIFHSDDIYHRKILKEQIAIFHSNTQIGVVFTEAIKIDELNQSLGEINFPFNVNKINCLSHDQLLILICKYSNFLICPSAMIDTKLIKKKII